MLRCVLVVLLFPWQSVALQAQQPDSAVSLEGFLQQDEGTSAWTLVVPLSIEAFHVRTFALTLVGKAEHWRDLRNLYVAVRGRVSRTGASEAPALGLAVQEIRETSPPGTNARTVDHGVGMRTRVTLSVIPDHFTWEDARGRPTGVNPLVLYTVLNERIGGIVVMQPTDLNFCVRVARPNGIATWDSTFPMPPTDARRFARESEVLREGIQLPRTAAMKTGHYVVRAGVCEAEPYALTADFDVQ